MPAAIASLYIPDTNWRPRGLAVGLISQYGKDYKESVPALLFVMDNPSEGMWNCLGTVADTLVKFGVDDATVLNAAVKLAKNDLWAHRVSGLSILGKLGPKAESVLPLIKKMADEDPHRKVRGSAARVIMNFKKSEQEK